MSSRGTHARSLAAALAACLCAVGAPAAGDSGGGGGGDSASAADTMHSQPDYLAGVQAINDKRWPEAIERLSRHVWRNDGDADGHNWLAYSYRNAGRLTEAFKHYQRALALDPFHLGAHEYIGEAYLMAGKPQDARRHLERLAKLCGTQCEQYKDLAAAIEKGRVSSTQ